MSTKHTLSSIEAIIEDPEDASMEGLKGSDEGPPCETSARHHQQQRSHEPEIRANTGKERSRKNRSQGNKASKAKAKNTAAKRAPVGAPRDFDADPPPARNRRNVSNQSAGSSSSSEDEEEGHIEDHRTALARARLTSPSMVSSITTLTTATNKSSSSSGSNSTVTQSSIFKRSNLGKRAEVEDAPLSPAAPDPPNVFTFIDNDPPLQQEPDSDEDEEEREQQVDDRDGERCSIEGTLWPKPRALMETAYEEPVVHNNPEQAGALSSASSSFHGDDTFSEQPAENDSDRSTSPEMSDHGKESSHAAPTPPGASDEHSAKIASQIAAARHRQNSWGSMEQYDAPEMPRGNVQRPHAPASVSSSRSQYQVSQRPLPRAENLPITGYELLATKLSSSGFDIDGGPRVRPIYRKFEALNHRLLLHLQDELSELEDQLHRIDLADTQSRRIDRHVVPASRRAAAQVGGELEWHKTDILGRIGFKLNQYNQALSSFNSTQSLSPPAPEEIEDYREYLYAEQPITESETHFLDPEEDLVSMSRHGKRRRHHHRSNSFESGSTVPSVISHSAISSRASTTHARSMPLSPSTSLPVVTPKIVKAPKVVVPRTYLPILAGAISLSVLLPILSFLVIPGVLGRVIVTILVALSAIGALLQTRLVESNVLMSQEGTVCAGLYGGVMLVIAGIMA